jgi:Zn-dependent metalloprotease
MIKSILDATCQIFVAILGKFRSKKTVEAPAVSLQNEQAITITIKADEENVETSIPVITKDKLLFQPNTMQANSPLECPIRSKNQQASTEISIDAPKIENFKITIECNETAINHLNNLCRFFEVNQPDALARGVWLLTIARDVEVNNKKLGIITTDQNGLIVDVMPINIV